MKKKSRRVRPPQKPKALHHPTSDNIQEGLSSQANASSNAAPAETKEENNQELPTTTPAGEGQPPEAKAWENRKKEVPPPSRQPGKAQGKGEFLLERRTPAQRFVDVQRQRNRLGKKARDQAQSSGGDTSETSPEPAPVEEQDQEDQEAPTDLNTGTRPHVEARSAATSAASALDVSAAHILILVSRTQGCRSWPGRHGLQLPRQERLRLRRRLRPTLLEETTFQAPSPLSPASTPTEAASEAPTPHMTPLPLPSRPWWTAIVNLSIARSVALWRSGSFRESGPKRSEGRSLPGMEVVPVTAAAPQAPAVPAAGPSAANGLANQMPDQASYEVQSKIRFLTMLARGGSRVVCTLDRESRWVLKVSLQDAHHSEWELLRCPSTPDPRSAGGSPSRSRCLGSQPRT